LQSSKISQLLVEVAAERLRQDEKWGKQSHEIFTVDEGLKELERQRHQSAMEQCKYMYDQVDEPGWDLILFEEVYEAFSATDPQEIRTELIQVAAVALAIVEDLDNKA
jgi:hypothetical protein